MPVLSVGQRFGTFAPSQTLFNLPGEFFMIASPLKKLIYKGMMMNPFCSCCGNVDEDLDHVFKGCTWAKEVWFHSPLGVRLDDSSLSFISWLE